MNKGQKIFQYVFLTIVSLLSVFPLYYMFCGATNKSTDVVAGKLIPGGYVAENFKALLANQDLARAMWNSFRNAVILTALALRYVPSQATALRFTMTKARMWL